MKMTTFRRQLENLLFDQGWEKVWVESKQETLWFISGYGLREVGSPGRAGSLLEALRQQLEKEEGGAIHG
jgi:hypothetical protein